MVLETIVVAQCVVASNYFIIIFKSPNVIIVCLILYPMLHPALPLPSTKVKAPQMLLNLIVGGVILTLSMGKIGKACLQNLAELLFARINLVMLDWSTKKPLPYNCSDWNRFQYFSIHFAWFALPLSGLGTGMLSLPWAMAGASILVGAVIIVLLVGVVACGTSNVHDCIGAYWCILVPCKPATCFVLKTNPKGFCMCCWFLAIFEYAWNGFELPLRSLRLVIGVNLGCFARQQASEQAY